MICGPMEIDSPYYKKYICKTCGENVKDMCTVHTLSILEILPHYQSVEQPGAWLLLRKDFTEMLSGHVKKIDMKECENLVICYGMCYIL